MVKKIEHFGQNENTYTQNYQNSSMNQNQFSHNNQNTFTNYYFNQYVGNQAQLSQDHGLPPQSMPALAQNIFQNNNIFNGYQAQFPPYLPVSNLVPSNQTPPTNNIQNFNNNNILSASAKEVVLNQQRKFAQQQTQTMPLRPIPPILMLDSQSQLFYQLDNNQDCKYFLYLLNTLF
jgi:hypothetical protein